MDDFQLRNPMLTGWLRSLNVQELTSAFQDAAKELYWQCRKEAFNPADAVEALETLANPKISEDRDLAVPFLIRALKDAREKLSAQRFESLGVLSWAPAMFAELYSEQLLKLRSQHEDDQQKDGQKAPPPVVRTPTDEALHLLITLLIGGQLVVRVGEDGKALTYPRWIVRIDAPEIDGGTLTAHCLVEASRRFLPAMQVDPDQFLDESGTIVERNISIDLLREEVRSQRYENRRAAALVVNGHPSAPPEALQNALASIQEKVDLPCFIQAGVQAPAQDSPRAVEAAFIDPAPMCRLFRRLLALQVRAPSTN